MMHSVIWERRIQIVLLIVIACASSTNIASAAPTPAVSLALCTNGFYPIKNALSSFDFIFHDGEGMGSSPSGEHRVMYNIQGPSGGSDNPQHSSVESRIAISNVDDNNLIDSPMVQAFLAASMPTLDIHRDFVFDRSTIRDASGLPNTVVDIGYFGNIRIDIYTVLLTRYRGFSVAITEDCRTPIPPVVQRIWNEQFAAQFTQLFLPYSDALNQFAMIDAAERGNPLLLQDQTWQQSAIAALTTLRETQTAFKNGFQEKWFGNHDIPDLRFCYSCFDIIESDLFYALRGADFQGYEKNIQYYSNINHSLPLEPLSADPQLLIKAVSKLRHSVALYQPDFPGVLPDPTLAPSAPLSPIGTMPPAGARGPLATTPTPYPTETPAPASQAAPDVAWFDPEQRINLVYPTSWQSLPLQNGTAILDIIAGDGTELTLYVAQAQGSPALGAQTYRNTQSERIDRMYTFDPPITETVAGLPAVAMSFQSVSTTNPNDMRTARIIYVNSGAWTFAFEYYSPGPALQHVDEIAAILRSVQFAPSQVSSAAPTPQPTPIRGVSTAAAAPQMTSVAWMDPERRLALTYPRTWQMLPLDPHEPDDAIELTSGDSVHLNIVIAPASGSASAGIAAYRDRLPRANPDRTFTTADIMDTTLGHTAAVSMAYSSVTSDGGNPHVAAVYYINTGGKQFVIEMYAEGTTWRHQEEISAILGSVVFLR